MSRRKVYTHTNDINSNNLNNGRQDQQRDWRRFCGMKLLSRNGLCCICVLFAFLWVGFELAFIALNVFPETELVLNSKCSNPVRNWDGKVLNIKVWNTSFYLNRPSYFNVHMEHEYNGRDSNHGIVLDSYNVQNRPVVIWGTHHKTGTFLAKKLFAKICGAMKWCCLFHVTRDSVHAVKDGLLTEPVDGFGHNQWIWYPEALGLPDYRFLHFYRHPFKKVISGYRYHADGTETWTQKATQFSYLCDTPLISPDKHDLISASNQNVSRLINRTNLVDRNTVREYCSSIHLCETCCRMEHEFYQSSNNPVALKYIRRSPEEYQFMCKYLGETTNTSSSLQDFLTNSPPQMGIAAEAALDYYENMRMARILNHTANDSRTLNIDLDDLSNNFEAVLWRLLMHLKDIIPEDVMQHLHSELLFYDLRTSPFYRWSMTNPIINHVTSQQQSTKEQQQHNVYLQGSAIENSNQDEISIKQYPNNRIIPSSELMEMLHNNSEVRKLYQPIMDYMRGYIEPNM